MTPRSTVPRGRHLRFFGLLVVALLGLASAGHFWHHLRDDCESIPQGSAHPCAQCAGFHGGALVEHAQSAVLPRLADVAAVFVGSHAERVEQPLGIGSPRAPPIA